MSDSFGSKLYWKNPADAGTYTWLAGLVEGEVPKAKKNKKERKTLDQTGRYIRFRGAFIDGGTAAIRLEFEKAQYAELLAAVEDPKTYPVKIVIPDAKEEDDRSTVEFDALFEELGTPLSEDADRLVAELTIQVSGPVVFTEGAGD